MNKKMVGILILFMVTTVRADAGLPDPTRPADYSIAKTLAKALPKQREEFNLNAIRISETDRSAIINGRLVRIGDQIGKATVKEINSISVVLEHERKSLTVPLFGAGISKLYKTTGSNE